MTRVSDFHATVHLEDGSYWAEVDELPGCFASGVTESELREAIAEAIRMWLGDAEPLGELRLAGLTLASA